MKILKTLKIRKDQIFLKLRKTLKIMKISKKN